MSNPQKWYNIYRDGEDKCFFVGKDGKSGLARSQYDWRTTESLSRESGLSKKRTEEIIDYYCKRSVVIQHPKDPEKWGYWETVGVPKAEVNPIKKDHDDRMEKQQGGSAKLPVKKSTVTGPTTVKGIGQPTMPTIITFNKASFNSNNGPPVATFGELVGRLNMLKIKA